jgi:hypothetical protein
MKGCMTVCVGGVAGWQEIVCEMKPETKSDHYLTHRQSISHCLTVSTMCCLRFCKYLLHEITSLLLSVDVRNAWRYTSSLRTPSYMGFLIIQNYWPFSLFHSAFKFTIYNGPTNALVCNKTLIRMSTLKHLKSLQHVSIISWSSSGSFFILVKIAG